MDLKKLTIESTAKSLRNKEFNSVELTKEFLKSAKEQNESINSYITITDEYALMQASAADSRGYENASLISGIPASVKDIFCTAGIRTTAASKILDDYTPMHESTVTSRLFDKGYVMIGKTNMDQFAHGSSGETSAYGFTHNPHDLDRIPGGSSSGAAASLASSTCVFAMGTETAGSIRNPAALCGLVGFKPTYGLVSRYGVVAMGSSLDSPGPLTKSVADAAIVLDVITGKDEKDMTSLDSPKNYYSSLDPSIIQNLTIGIPEEYLNLPGLSARTIEIFNETVEVLKKLGVKFKTVHLLDPNISAAVYTVICRAEVSSNLGRYNGVIYSHRSEMGDTWADVVRNSRQEGFGTEAKRRTMTGTLVLSKGYTSKLYKKAEEVRNLLRDDFANTFKEVDLILSPVTPTPAIKLGSADENPLFGELSDIFCTASSLAGLPAISLPMGLEGHLPVGIQLMAPHLSEQTLLNASMAVEREVEGFIKQ